MENNESEKQNFKFPERWGICAIILLLFLLFVSAIAYITEFSNLTQYFVSLGTLSLAIWFYYDVIKIFELVENVVRDEKTLKLLNEEKKENERLKKKILESEKDKNEKIKIYKEMIEIKDEIIKIQKEMIGYANEIMETIEKNENLKKDNIPKDETS